MADEALAPSEDPFEQLASGASPSKPEPAAPAVANDNQPSDNPFADLGDVGPGQSSATGAFARGAEKGVVPAAAGLVGAGAGGAAAVGIGALAGATIGPWGAAGGAIVGALAAGYAGSYLQNTVISHMPDTWRDALGIDDRQARLDESQHSVASFLGGLFPAAATMSPRAAIAALPKNATAMQQIMAHPLTARLFGGGFGYVTQTAQDLVTEGHLDWKKEMMSTAFGVVFNRPTHIGERIIEVGAHPTRSAFGTPHPTVAQVGDLNIMGPGITEEVFQGTQERAPDAAMTAQEHARVEHEALGEAPEPDLHGVARQMEPELFAKYDDLIQRHETFRAWHGEGPGHDMAEKHLAATEEELREISPQIQAAYRRAEETMAPPVDEPEQFPSFAAMLAARENETGGVSRETNLPEVSGEAAPPEGQRDAGTVLPAVQSGGAEGARQELEGSGVEGGGGQPSAAAGVPVPQRTIGDQRAAIAADVTRNLIAAGRPEEEARAAGQLAAARYVTRAGRFAGKLGTPEELYAREGAAIAGPGGRPQVPAGAPTELPKTVDAAKKILRGRAAADPKTWSLFEFLASEGGIKPTADLRSIFGGKNPFVPGFGPLLREGGISLEDALIRAKENSYVFDPNDLAHVPHDATRPQAGELTKTVNDLQDMVSEESRGYKQYRNDHIPPESKVNADEERKSILDALHRELRGATGDQQLKIDPMLEDRVVEIIQKEGEHDVLSAYERAIMEDHDRFEGLRNDRQATERIPGWDAPDARSASEHGEGGIGERGQGGIPDEAAREDHGGEPQDAGARNREAALAQDVEEYFQRVYHGSDYEPGAEGKPQSLIPGVAPVSQRDMIQAAANKPLAPKVGQKPVGGLFGDSMDQKELFQTARGTIKIAPGKRPIITLMKDANASTFIHESGHQYLEELMRDAAHGEAPEILQKDAAAVRDWLGVETADDIKTKHHEKFARGFEQYVREGVAPSKELAGVFAKFRDWLLSIYQSIRGLGTEINPNIRGVFDRLLEMEPQRTVVAPERQSPSLLHDIHEAEAQHIQPHEAEPAMDRIVAEYGRHIQDQPPEIQRELETAAVKVQEAQAAAGGAPTGEGGAGAGGSSEVVGDRGGPVAEPAGGAGGAEHGEVKPGGGGAGAEGDGAQRIEPRSKLGDSPGTALAPGPTDLFGDVSPYTDRAGNIRLDTLNTSEDVKQAIRASAAENNEFIGDRRGAVTDGQVMELANDIGMSGAEGLVAQHVAGQAFNAEQVVALRKLLRESAANVSTAAKKFAASGSDEDVLAFAQAKDRLQMVQKTVAGVTAEAGRALRAFRTLPGEQDTKAIEQMIAEATGKTLFQLKTEAKLAAGIDTPQKMNKFMQNVDNRSLGGMVLEAWINGLLSGPSTQVANIVSNAVFSVQTYGPEKAVGALVGGLLHAAGRKGTYTRIGEVGAAAKGAVQGAAPAALAAGESFKKGATGLLPGEEEPASGILSGILHDDMLARGTLDPNATLRDVQAAVFGTSRGVRDAIVAGGALLKAGGVEGSPFMSTKYDVQGAIPDIQVRGMNLLPIGTAIRSTGRFLATADTFAASLNYSASINAIAYRTAADEGLAGSAFTQRIAQLRNNPTPEMMQEARGQARQATFMDKGGEFIRAINNLTSKSLNLPVLGNTQPLKFVAPFTNVISRILEQTIVKRTPIGALLSKELQADLLGKNGNIAQDTAAARMLIGSASLLAFGALAAENYITGSGPKDAKENAIWRLTHQPHSVKIGSSWYQVQKLGPMGMLMSMAADLHDIAHLAQGNEWGKAAATLFHAIVQNTLDQSALQGPADLIKAVETPDQYGQQYIKGFLSSFVPSSVNWIAKSRDPYIRQTWGVIDAMKARIPGLSETLHPKIDLWGEPVPGREQLGGMTGIYMKNAAEDPVNKAMGDLGMAKGMPPKKLRNVELNPDQYEYFSRMSGRMAKMRLDVMVRSPQWETFPAYMKMKVISETIDGSRRSAEGLVFAKWPSILVQARDDKLTLIKTGKKAVH